MKPFALLVLFFFVVQTFCRVPSNREGKWFGYTYTSTVTKSQHVTSLIPSSCVRFAATLPPCRNARSYDTGEGRFLFRNTVENAEATTVSAEKRVEPVQNSTGWGQYLGLLPPSVTVTQIKLEVTRMLDPGSVLTFSITGCKPSKLPLDLPKCPEETTITPTPSVVNIITTTILNETPSTQANTNLDNGEPNVNNQQSSTSTQTLTATPTTIVENANNS